MLNIKTNVDEGVNGQTEGKIDQTDQCKVRPVNMY